MRLARRSLGLTQQHVAASIGISQSLLSRIERGASDAGIVTLSTVTDQLGLELSVRVYPGGTPLRDAGHVRLLSRVQAKLPDAYRWRTEVPIPLRGDLRAVDAMIIDPSLGAGFELETRLLDAQGVVRRAVLKQRDAALACMILVLPDTQANRAAAADAAATLRASFPLEGRALLAALRERRTPPENGVLFV